MSGARTAFDIPEALGSLYSVTSGRTTVGDLATDLRAGLGFAPPGSRIAFDLCFVSLGVPHNWYGSVAYRF